MALPPSAPYVVADSMAVHPWHPTDDPHARPMGKRRATHQGFNRYAGSQVHDIGQYALYRARFNRACDVTDAWGEFWRFGSAIQPLCDSFGPVDYGPCGYRGGLRPPGAPNDSKGSSDKVAKYGLLRFTENAQLGCESGGD